MHLVTLSASVETPKLSAGSYLASDSTTAKMLAYNPGVCSVASAPFFDKDIRRFDDLNGKSVLVCRMGAGGDILACTPALRELKRKFPEVRIGFACFPTFASLLENNPNINEVVSNPVRVDVFERYDAVVWLDDAFADEETVNKTDHITKIVMDKVGLPYDPNQNHLDYFVTEEEKAAALARFPRGDRKRIAVQISASEPARTWPKEQLREFSILAIKKGYTVFWVGWPHETGFGTTNPPDHLIDVTRAEPSMSIRECAALVSTMDGGVFPDSLWYHVGSALNVPTVGLFAAFPSELRETSASAFNINGRVGCEIAPCFYYGGRPGTTSLPENGPCSKTGYCCAMMAIEPDRVLSLLERQME